MNKTRTLTSYGLLLYSSKSQGLPLGAVQQALLKDGVIPSIKIPVGKKSAGGQHVDQTTRRKKVHFTSVNKERIDKSSLWHSPTGMVDIDDFDENEINKMFSESRKPTKVRSVATKKATLGTIQAVESRS